jgi:hypothetical protein
VVREFLADQQAMQQRTLALPGYAVAILTDYRRTRAESRERNGHGNERIVYVFGTRDDKVKGRATSAATSRPSSMVPGSKGAGRLGSCGIPSCRECPTKERARN